ncbi:hypothetical protein RJ639_025157 [Escallonia herrerae]|uniref:Integrase zinc-binding domain-containing protein n=1 Tax=Escallonia herrerae TaxID=1293975 RepID=A0AA89ABP0_9ASTE|nr:hypothetical protein RJ639_025157 [Escallonia herrerae]
MLKYRAGSTNSVADALSRRAKLDQVALMAMNAIVRVDSRVAINIGKKIRKALTRDPVAQQLLKLIESGKTRQFWQEDGLLMTKGRRVYIPRVDDLRRTLIRECHDTLWAGYTGGERTLALLQQGYYWAQMGDEVQEYVKTCLTYQQDKVERKKKAGLLQLLPLGECVIGFHHWAAEVKKIGKMAYKVDPPYWWSRQFHPVFHVSMLKPFHEDTADPSRGQIKRQGLKPKAAGKRVAEAILNDRVITASRKRHQEYLVKWQG